MKSGSQADGIYPMRVRYPMRIQDLTLQIIRDGTMEEKDLP